MKRLLFALILLGVIAGLGVPAAGTVSAAVPQYVVVNWGDTLYSIAVRYGTTVGALVQANGLPNANFVYAGQHLLIPSSSYVPPAPSGGTAPSASAPAYYTVHAGDTLYSIAARFGTSVAALAQLNHLWNYNFIYTGQQLRVGAVTAAPAPKPTAPPAPPSSDNPPAPSNPISSPNPPSITNPTQPPPPPGTTAPDSGKWIDINIGKQTITAYEGPNAVKTVLVSTGIPVHPTPVGKYKIYSKYSAFTMSGGTRGVDYYYLPNVPWTMFFVGGYAIHGTYWHHNFGHPMSHGCVNLSIADAKWFYDWAPIGTTVITHL
jgi:LysM repeat protein